MRIGVAQTCPRKGNVPYNTAQHTELLALAISLKTDALFFPELSLSGYEPTLAEALAIFPHDTRLDEFQEISNRYQIVIGLGMPTKSPDGNCISTLLFLPHLPIQVYSKQYLHPDEAPYFVAGKNPMILKLDRHAIGLAICYELFVPAHADQIFREKATIYVASVAKSAQGMAKAHVVSSDIAQKHAAHVLLSNCTGLNDGMECSGQSAVWDNKGNLLDQFSGKEEGILVLDLETNEVFKKNL